MNVVLRIWLFIQGYITLKVENRPVERVLNMAVMRDIMVWDVRELEDGGFCFRLTLKDYELLRSELEAFCEPVGRAGLPPLLAEIRSRRVFVLGALLFLILLYTVTSCIWFVEITGTEKLSEQELLEVVQEAGLRPGVPRSRIDPEAIEVALISRFPRIGWAGLTIRGTKVIIEIVEKTQIKAEEHPDLFAARDALVEELIVFQGVPEVEEGEIVKKGDLLIRGKRNDEEGDLVVARGLIRGRVWYEVEGRAQLSFDEYLPTGESAVSYRMRAGDRSFHIWGPRYSPYRFYERQLSSWKPAIEMDFGAEYEFIRVIYHELERHLEQRGQNQALALARRQALDVLSESVGDEAVVLARKETVYGQDSKNLIRVLIEAEVLEDIGTRREP